MPTEREVYARHAEEYERLVSREDWQGNIGRALSRFPALRRGDVLDLGAGTGRLTRLLAPLARRVWALDESPHMLLGAAAALGARGLGNAHLALADHRRLPVRDGAADAVVAGWSLCYLAVWGGPAWRSELDAALVEMQRVLRPGGLIVLLETLGTGHESPAPPAHLGDYFAWLGRTGFRSRWIRTDYRFDSLAEAESLMAFFFGDEMARAVGQSGSPIVPECTGVWWRTS